MFPRLRFTLVIFVISSKMSWPVNDYDRNATGKSERHSSLFRWDFITMTSAFRFSAHTSRCGPGNEDRDDVFSLSIFSLIINGFWWAHQGSNLGPAD